MDAVFNKHNQQIPDPTPVELPLGYTAPPTLQEMVAQSIAVHSALMAKHDMDTEEEANDFDISDEEFAGDSRHVYTELQEEQLKDLETAFRSRANRVPASDAADHDDDGEPPLSEEELQQEEARPSVKPGFKGKKRANKQPQPDAADDNL